MRQSHSEPPMQQYVPVFTQDPCGFSAKIVGLSPDDLDDEDFECLMAFVRKRMEERGLSEGLSVAMSIREGCICLRFRFFRSDAEGGEAQVHAAGGRRGTHEVSESWLPGTGAAVDGFEQGPAGSMAAPEPVTLHARATADRVTWTRPTEDARRDFAGSVGSTHWTEAGGSSMPGHGSDISGLTADELLNLLPARLRPQVLAITLIPNLAAQEPGPFTPRVPPTVLPSEGSILTLGLVRTVTLEMPQVASGSLVASTDSGTQRDSVPIVWSSYPARTKPLKILSVETEDPDPNSRALTGLCRVKVALPRPSPSGLLLLHACFQSRSPNSRASDSPNTTPMDTTASLHASDVRAGLLPVPRTERSFLVVPDKGLATELETCSAHDADSEPLPPQTLLHIKSDLLADLEASLLMLSTCLTSSPRSPHTQLNLAARAVGNMISFAHGRGMSLFSHALSVLQVECNELRRPYQLRWLPVLRFASDVVEHKYLASVLEPFATLQRNMVLQQCVVLHAFFLALGTGFSSLPIAHLDYLAATAVYLGLNWLLTARRDRCASPSTIPNILRSSSLKATEPEPPSAVSSVLLKRFVNSEAFLHLYCASLVLLHFTTHLRRVRSRSPSQIQCHVCLSLHHGNLRVFPPPLCV